MTARDLPALALSCAAIVAGLALVVVAVRWALDPLGRIDVGIREGQ